MPAILPLQKRRAIVELANSGYSYPEIASALEISVGSVYTYVALSRRTGTLSDYHTWLRKIMAQSPETRPGELQAQLAGRGLHVSRAEIKRALKALGFRPTPSQS